MAEYVVAVVGNPNCGKTTLFNALTGSTQTVGNWPGVTVEKKDGYFSIGNDTVKVVDLPGIYALSATSEDEVVALDYVLTQKYDLVVDVIDSTNLERNLYLTVQLAEMQVPMMAVLNMMDIAHGRGIDIDLGAMSKALNCGVYSTSAIKSNYADQLKKDILKEIKAKKVPSINVPYPKFVQDLVSSASKDFVDVSKKFNVSADWIALRVIEKTSHVVELLKKADCSVKQYSSTASNDKPEVVIAEARYKSAKDLVDVVIKDAGVTETFSDKVDKVVLNRIFGIPVFLLAMYLTFWTTLAVGNIFTDFFDQAFGAIFVDGAAIVYTKLGLPGWIVTLLSSGVGDGIKTVSTFVPIVFVMFVCLAILEDSGYMARAAFVMDRFMYQMGLPGKSFVPMLVGFGCTVPAVMASRTLDNPRDRILTIFMTPFMSCGARLPVYALFGAAFFGSKAGLVVFSLYIFGAIMAILTGLLLNYTMFKGEPSYFIMELPPYHFPRLGNTLRSAWGRLKSFIIRAGIVIVIGVTILGFFNSFGVDGTFGNQDKKESVLSVIGKGVTPLFEPMGVDRDNWPASVALFTGLFAKESIIGTLNGLYAQNSAVDDEDEEDAPFHLGEALKGALYTIPENALGVVEKLIHPTSTLDVISDDEEVTAQNVGADSGIYKNMRAHFTEGPFQVYAYLVFILLYIPCLAAVSAIVKEIGGRLTVVLSLYLLILGWSVATLVYQIGVGKSPLWIATSIILLLLTGFTLRFLGKKAS